MAPAEVDRLLKLYQRLSRKTLDSYSFPSDVADLVFEIITADTFIAGLADKIISGSSLAPNERAILSQELLTSQGFWRMDDGSSFDLEPFPAIKEHAALIESVRKESLRLQGGS